MSSFTSSAPFPAMMLAIGCLTGLIGTRFAPEDAVRKVAEPQAAMANLSTPDKGADDLAPEAQTEGDAKGVPTIRAIRASDGLFYVRAEVNGRRMRFLVDTGASYTVLRAADAQALGLTPDSDRFGQRVQTAGGSTPMAWTHISDMKLAGRDLHGVRAMVVRSGLGVSLLGQNMLSRMGSVTIEGDQLVLR